MRKILAGLLVLAFCLAAQAPGMADEPKDSGAGHDFTFKTRQMYDMGWPDEPVNPDCIVKLKGPVPRDGKAVAKGRVVCDDRDAMRGTALQLKITNLDEKVQKGTKWRTCSPDTGDLRIRTYKTSKGYVMHYCQVTVRMDDRWRSSEWVATLNAEDVWVGYGQTSYRSCTAYCKDRPRKASMLWNIF